MLFLFINNSDYIRNNKAIVLLDPNAVASQEIPEFTDNRRVYGALYLLRLVPEILAEILL
jgi:hypothetical protein